MQVPKHTHWVLAGLAFLVFLPFLGTTPLFDWDEINFAESTREMLISGQYFQNQINFEPFWEKPPLFFWLQGLSMQLWGVNEWGARFPNVICGIATLLVLFQIGKRRQGAAFGLLWALLYLGSWLPHLYVRSGIIDPVFNLFIFLGLYVLIRLMEVEGSAPKRKYALLAGLFVGLAILTKGPAGLLIILLTVGAYWAWGRFKPLATFGQIAWVALMAFLVASFWFGYETIRNGPWFLQEFIVYQLELVTGRAGGAAAGHQQPFFYHFVVVLLGCFPISFLVWGQWQVRKGELDLFRRWMWLLFAVVMLLFSAISTKIVHYSSMAYLPLSYLSADYVWRWCKKDMAFPSWIYWAMGLYGSLLGLIIAAVPLFGRQAGSWLKPVLKDPLAQAALDVPVSWNGWEGLAGLLYAGIIWWSLNCLRKRDLRKFAWGQALGLCLLMLSTAGLMLPKIERYTQGPAIDFYSELAGQDVYVWPLKHKSYAHYFYAQTQPLQPSDGLYQARERTLSLLEVEQFGDLDQEQRVYYRGHLQNWLMTGDIDKPAYFVIKADKYKPGLYPTLEVVMQEGLFIGLRRLPQK